MSPEALVTLKDAGSGLLVLIMAVMFLRYLDKSNKAQQRYLEARDKAQREAEEKRDRQNQDFLTRLNQSSDQKSDKIALSLDKLAALLTEHDIATKEAIAKMEERTRPKGHTQE